MHAMALQAQLDRQLEPLGQRTLLALGPEPGEHILDIGCGAGQTTLALAQACRPGGLAVGLDISRPLLRLARDRATADVTFLEADAQTFAFAPASFDAAFSRFGVMFFADPIAAFANIRRALKPGGRLAFVCWRSPAENPFMTLPMAAAAALLPAQTPPTPGGPGPFAFADPEHVRRILTAAGFSGVEIVPHDEKIGSGDLDQAITVALRVGPLGAMLREHPDKREAVIGAVRGALGAHDGPDGVKLASASWIVTARA